MQYRVKCHKCSKVYEGTDPLVTEGRARHCCSPPLVVPVVLTLPRAVLSQNKTTYAHWSAHSRDKAHWVKLLQRVAGTYIGLDLEYSEWSLIRRYAGRSKPYDFANLVGGAKPLIDSLVQLGIIRDDSEKHFKCSYSQEKGRISDTVLTLERYETGTS